MVSKLLNKKSSGSGFNMHANNKIKQNHQLVEELNKSIIKKFKKRTVFFRIQRQYLGC